MVDLKRMDTEALQAHRAQLDGALRGSALMGVEPDPEGVRELRAVEAELQRRNAPKPQPEDDPFGVAGRLK